MCTSLTFFFTEQHFCYISGTPINSVTQVFNMRQTTEHAIFVLAQVVLLAGYSLCKRVFQKPITKKDKSEQAANPMPEVGFEPKPCD